MILVKPYIWKVGRPVARGIEMGEKALFCSSSGTPLVEKSSTSFPCPGCGESIGRSPRCRVQAVIYVCKSCGFEGP